MKKLILIALVALCALPAFSQTIPGAPGYQLPNTVVAQKWYGTAAPTSALNYPTQPGDLFYDTTNKNVYWCAAPVTSTIPLQGGPAACTSVTSGQWTLIAGYGGTGVSSWLTQSTGSIAMTLTNLQSLNTVPFQILPAVAGTMYVMGPCTLNLTYGSAAFSGGGTVSIGYGTSSSPATNGTIASTVFTTFTASHGVVVIPSAVAVTATTSLVNTGIYMTAASANFTSGTGATGELSCQYSAVTGVS